MNLRDEGYRRGHEIGSEVDPKSFLADREREFIRTRQLYPTLGDVDFTAAIRDYDRERLSCEPDYTHFPEMKGLLERHLAEREGFRDTTGLDECAAAYQFSWHFFVSRRVNAHHLARYDLLPSPANCTNVFFPHGKEGVTISDNRDDTLRQDYAEHIPEWKPGRTPINHPVHWVQGGASSAVLLDEEPECSFPCNPHELIPNDCLDDINAICDFMTRYRDFYGPGNQIWVDRSLNAVAVEKSNCRVAYRWPTTAGAVCITACSYLDAELNAFKMERTRQAMEIKGETEDDSPDWSFFEGADRRHRRLIALTDAEARDGATLRGAFDIVADTAVPYPDRICLAGEKLSERESAANWTLTQFAAVVTGPNRRALYRSLQDLGNPRPIVSYPPKLLLGEGVEMKDGWKREVEA